MPDFIVMVEQHQGLYPFIQLWSIRILFIGTIFTHDHAAKTDSTGGACVVSEFSTDGVTQLPSKASIGVV